MTTRCPRPAVERGALRLNQRELVRGTGVFARAEVELPGRVFASTAVRHDRVDFTVRDAFVNGTNADDSGNRTLQAVSPMFGVAWRVRPLLSLYANVSSAFETPTITELTNQDNGAAGVNRSLAPQRTATVEGGLQSIVASRLRVDVAVFRARVRDELVPFDVPNAPGRRAFRNAGRTARYGIEASVQGHVAATDVGLAYAYSHFRFDEYRIGPANYAGNPIPGIPDQQLQAYSTVRFQGLYGTAEVSAVSHISADDAAAVFAAGYATWALRGGYTGYTARGVHGRWSAEPVAGVENLFDRRFASSVVINATRFRSFEPGSRRRAYLGLKLGAR